MSVTIFTQNLFISFFSEMLHNNRDAETEKSDSNGFFKFLVFSEIKTVEVERIRGERRVC